MKMGCLYRKIKKTVKDFLYSFPGKCCIVFLVVSYYIYVEFVWEYPSTSFEIRNDQPGSTFYLKSVDGIYFYGSNEKLVYTEAVPRAYPWSGESEHPTHDLTIALPVQVVWGTSPDESSFKVTKVHKISNVSDLSQIKGKNGKVLLLFRDNGFELQWIPKS